MTTRRLGSWQAWTLRRATLGDVRWVAAVVGLAIATVVSGRYARLGLRPRAAAEVARMLDGLEQPSGLPDAPLAEPSGATETLFARTRGRRAIVAFYAPWCGPCQKELPMLAQTLKSEDAQLLVVISQSEDLEDTRRQLTNLGLGDLDLYTDVSGRLFEEAHVVALPSTFLITGRGAVIARAAGYSPLAIRLMLSKASAARRHSDTAPDGGAP
jgi:thiol-disulfide isomerase/thioredoxin